MARGNQRDKAREKNLKKKSKQQKVNIQPLYLTEKEEQK